MAEKNGLFELVNRFENAMALALSRKSSVVAVYNVQTSALVEASRKILGDRAIPYSERTDKDTGNVIFECPGFTWTLIGT